MISKVIGFKFSGIWTTLWSHASHAPSGFIVVKYSFHFRLTPWLKQMCQHAKCIKEMLCHTPPIIGCPHSWGWEVLPITEVMFVGIREAINTFFNYLFQRLRQSSIWISEWNARYISPSYSNPGFAGLWLATFLQVARGADLATC
jgi:hypothetical protein